MNPELITQYDAAVESLGAFAGTGHEDAASIEARLARDVAESRLQNSRAWFSCWVLAPLGTLRAFEGLHRQMVVALADVRLELTRLGEEIARLRQEGRQTEAEPFARRRVALLRHQAALAARLEARAEERATAAQRWIARRLEAALRFTAQEAADFARHTFGETAARAQRALGQIEDYNRLAREASTLAGGLELPGFLPEDVARARGAASLSSVRLEAATVAPRPEAAADYRFPSASRPLAASQARRTA